MKTIDLFCASQASTAICSSMDSRAIVRHGTRPGLDRRIVHRLGEHCKNRTYGPPCSSQLPMDPTCRSRKSTNTSNNQTEPLRRKSSADVEVTKSPTKYLLSDKPYVDFILNNNERAIVPSQVGTREISVKGHDSDTFRSSSTKEKSLARRLSDHLIDEKTNAILNKSSSNQVVELRVSIHCKGCEGKLRKHISRMEGVKSFSINLDTKKVTIVGEVTPLGVLSSISKVKNAQFWPSPASTSSSSSSSTPRTSHASTPRLSHASTPRLSHASSTPRISLAR